MITLTGRGGGGGGGVGTETTCRCGKGFILFQYLIITTRGGEIVR